jgi:gliding motility-associated-like protein
MINKHLLLLFFGISSFSAIRAQCAALTGLTGDITDPVSGLIIQYTATLSPTQSIQTFNSLNNSCGIFFPPVPAPFSGLNGTAPNTITYSFSEPISSVDVIIAFIGVINSSLATEIFTFNTDTGVPTISVNSGSCPQMNVNGNVSDNIGVFGALNAIHTVSSTIPFNSFTITTVSSGSTNWLLGIIGNGGSAYALCDNSITSICPPPQINLGPDTLLCDSDTLLIDATISNGTYLWNDNSNQSSYLITGPGIYYVEAQNACGLASDTLVVTYSLTPSLDLGVDTTLCNGESYTIDVNPNNNDLVWQDGSTNNFITVNQSGIYWGEISNSCGVFTDSIEILFVNPPTLTADFSLDCDGLSVFFDINLDWNNGTANLTNINFGDGNSGNFSNPTHTYSNIDTYNAFFSATSQEGCATVLNLPVTLYQNPTATISSNSFCSAEIDFFAEPLVYNPDLSIITQFWLLQGDSINSINPSINNSQPSGTYDGVYGLVLSDSCVYYFPFQYFLESPLSSNSLELPNVITPNGDGQNDRFVINESFDLCATYRIEFLNRWGQLIYIMTNNEEAFEGLDFQGKMLPEGTYFYRFSSEIQKSQGFFSILR